MNCKHCGQPIAQYDSQWARPYGSLSNPVWYHVYSSGQRGPRECSTKLAEPDLSTT